MADEYTVSGKLSFPAATAGDVVKIYVGAASYTKKVGRTGDTSLFFVMPSVPTGTLGYFSAYVDRDDDGYKTVDDFGGLGGSYTVIDHQRDLVLTLNLNVGIRGTITIPAPQAVGTRFAMVAIETSGWPLASYTTGTTDSAPSSINYEIGGKVGTVRVLYIYDLDNSGVGMGSISTSTHRNTFLTSGDYYWLSDPVSLTTASASEVNGTMQTMNLTGYSNFIDWLATH